ncbi:hypothetical protein GJ496_010009 [Pomphorhynchus laevis]|nr:hypothetical protein GJ496_010009 [Pomphorhynchus laevis]
MNVDNVGGLKARLARNVPSKSTSISISQDKLEFEDLPILDRILVQTSDTAPLTQIPCSYNKTLTVVFPRHFVMCPLKSTIVTKSFTFPRNFCPYYGLNETSAYKLITRTTVYINIYNWLAFLPRGFYFLMIRKVSRGSGVTKQLSDYPNSIRNDGGLQETKMISIHSRSSLISMAISEHNGFKICFVIIFTVIDCGSFIGNCLVICAIISTRHLNLPQNYLIVSLAFVDLMLSIGSMPLYITTNLLNGKWKLGFQFCRLFMIFDVTLSCASILNLCAVSIDRYIALFYPIKYRFKRNNYIIFMLFFGSWFLSSSISLPLMFLNRSELYQQSGTNEHTCIIPNNKLFISIALVLGYYIPLSVMVYTNCCIYIRLKHRKKKIGYSNKKAAVFSCKSTCLSDSQMQPGYSRLVIKKDDRLSLTICGVVVSTIICWSPFFILLTLSIISDNPPHIPQIVQEVSLWLGYLNSLINPILYNFTNSDFRRRLRICLK